MKRVYTLYRVSTKKQVNVSENHDNDIPMQRGACKEFVKYRQDWEIVKEYEEKGVSGFKVSAKNRDAILDLQEAALNKEFDVLLVFMFDRIGRIDDETPFIVEWFVKTAGVEVWSVKEGEQRFETHVDKLTNYIRFWQASGESEKTSIRIKTRIQQLKLDGLYTGGALPYGYRIVPSGTKNRKGQELKKYEIDLEQYVVYRKIVEKTINNGTGSYVMAHFLNDQGYKTANGKKFTSKAILRILSASLPRGYTSEGETSEALQKLKIISDEEAARIDGATTFRTFWKVIFPIMKPMHATVAVITALSVWNDVMTPLVIMSGSGMNTLPLAQMTFQTQFGTNYNLAFASYLLALLPILIFYIVCQKQILNGVVNGAVK